MPIPLNAAISTANIVVFLALGALPVLGVRTREGQTDEVGASEDALLAMRAMMHASMLPSRSREHSRAAEQFAKCKLAQWRPFNSLIAGRRNYFFDLSGHVMTR